MKNRFGWLLATLATFGFVFGQATTAVSATIAATGSAASAQQAAALLAGAAKLNAPVSPTDESKVPHYFGPYPNWANSPQVLSDAVVTITGGGGADAAATATVDPKLGGISGITVTSPGTGYTSAPQVEITAPGVTPKALAAATATISPGVLTSITVAEAGYGFTTPTATITGGGTPSAPASIEVSGGVDDLVLTSGGKGYLIEPLVTFTLPDAAYCSSVPAPATPCATATGTATMTADGVVDGVAVVNPGSGYTTAPQVEIRDGEAVVLVDAASAVATIGIGQIDVLSGGAGYDSVPVVTIEDSVAPLDKGASAVATVATMGAVTSIKVDTAGAGYLTPGLKKFVDTLAGLGPENQNNLGEYIPVAVPDTTTYPGTDYYEIAVVQYRQKFASGLPESLLRGYVQLSTAVIPGAHVQLTNENLDPSLTATPIVGRYGVDNPHYLGPTVVATKNRPVRILFRNLLPTGVGGDLFLPVDSSMMGSGAGPEMMSLDPTTKVPLDMAPDERTVTDGVRNPMCGETPKPTTCYSENRSTMHLHGGITPWISDGTPHQWVTPAGEDTSYPDGVSVSNVPDMPDPGPGAQTFFYTNQQSARLMWYHDHSWGITRLNVYAGEAAPYLITDDTEKALIAPTGALASVGSGTPLIIQDKTFVPDAAALAQQDPTWNTAKWGGKGNLWTPHVYMPAQNPGDPSGMSSFGRWMYGPWFWPPAKDAKYAPIANPYYDATCDPDVEPFCEPAQIPGTPNVSVGMEAFNDTPIVNGTAYPTTTVDPKAYRYKILNAANDRFWNLSWYVADPTTGTLSEVALKPAEVAAAQTDINVVPSPDTTKSPAGPSWVQIGTEGGFLPAPVIVPAQPTTWITDPTRFDVGNVDKHSLLLAPAERADVIVDFSAYKGKTLILYNDAPAAFPARVAGYDYYTGGPDLAPAGAPTTLPGYGPNTRTVMQVKVANTAPALAFDRPNTTADRMGALNTAFGHKADGSGVFESGQNPIIVGQDAYDATYGTNFAAAGNCNGNGTPTARCDGFARISEQGGDMFKFDTLGANKDGKGAQLAVKIEGKGIHDEMNSASFDEFGRMTANMGLEAPGATPLLQNIILYPYTNPATEVLDATKTPSSLDVTPISSAADGTQIWKITHNGVDTHPLHFHLYDVQVLNRVTWDNIIMPPEPTELGWKDTVRISPLEDTIVAVRPIVPTLPFGLPDSVRPLNPMMPLGAKGAANGILGTEAGFNNTDTAGNPIAPIENKMTNFEWEYVWHCHILSHEEMDMMRPVTVHVARALPAAPVLTFTRGSVDLAWTDGTPVDYLNPSTWTDPTRSGEVGYRVDRAEVIDGVIGTYAQIAKVPANTVVYKDNPPDPTTTYAYRVTAWNAAGDAPSNVITVVGLPKAPTALTAVVQAAPSLPAGAQVAVGWTNNATNATNVVVERAVGAGAFSVVATLPPTDTTWTDTDVVPGPYSYQVKAVDVVGSSAYAGPVTVTVLQPGSTTVVLNAPNPSVVGQAVTFTATVSPVLATGTPSGTVTFTVNGATTAVPLDPTGIVTFTTSTLPAGTSTLTADYSGDAVFAASAGTATQTVTKFVTATALVTGPNPSLVGQDVTFTATVSPTAGGGVPTGSVTFTAAGTTTIVPLDGAGVAALTTATLPTGSTVVTADYSGDGANATSSATATQVVDLNASTTALVTGPNPSLVGQDVTFTATVSPTAGAGVPTGSVTFTAGGTTTTVPLTGGVATMTTAVLLAGTTFVTADYSGDAAYATSSSTATQHVRDVSSTVVVSSLNPSVVGQDVTFTATVSPGLGTSIPSGSVTFTVGSTVTIVPVDATGMATVTTAALLAGDTIVTADFSGDSAYAPSSGTLTQTAVKAVTTTVVVSSVNPSIVGGDVTFTATVSPAGVRGAVLFSVDGVTTGAFLVGNQATFTTSTLAIGGHPVSATYTGDAAFLGSTSPTFTQTVGPVLRLTTTTVTSNRVPTARLGQSVTFTATVRPVAGTGTPTGTVQLSIDGVNVGGIQTVNAQGRVTYTTATLSAGSHTVVASYGGSAIFAGSGSATFTQLVNTAASATAVTSSVNPAVSGQTVTFTARVTPAAATGTVQFRLDGADVGGPVTLDATGRAPWVTNALTVGAHTVSAVYSGNVNYSPSTSANRAQTVNKATSRTTVASSGSPAPWQSTVIFTATVAVRAPGGGIPTGMVQFRIDGVNAGPAVPVSPIGQAAYANNLMAIGRHTVTAVYTGDASVTASTSAAITQRIQ